MKKFVWKVLLWLGSYEMIANWRRRLGKELQHVDEGGVMVGRGGD